MNMNMNMMRGSCTSTISSSSVSRCQECGNQAKRDCEYMRCRTCCKSRGFDCPTHVKSTWIPLSLRRPRQYYFQQHQPHHHHHPPPPPPPPHQLILPNSKRYKPFNLSSSSSSPGGLQRRDFPGEVKTRATFRCVRMMSGDNVVDQCAYQTVVDIGGHVFKGLLYDQGPILTDNEDEEEDEDEEDDEDHDDHDACYNSGGGDHVRDLYHHSILQQQQHQHQPNLNMSTTTCSAAPATAPTNTNNGDAVTVTSSSYASPFYPFMPAGTLYFPYPKS